MEYQAVCLTCGYCHTQFTSQCILTMFVSRPPGGLWERSRLHDFPHQFPRCHCVPSMRQRRFAHPDRHDVVRLWNLLHVLHHGNLPVLPR